MYQTQAQLNSQLVKQKQDFVSCNNTFGILLSTMESFLIISGYKLSVLFGYYNYYDITSWKSKQDIKNQLYANLMAYKISKMAYVKKYGKFDYPDYPSIKKIIEIINQWKNLSNDPEEKKLCDEILELIKDENQKPLSYYQNRIENTHKSSRSDPIQQFQFSQKIHNQIDKRDEEIKYQLEQNPNAQFGLTMGGQPGNGEFSNIEIPNSAECKDQYQLNLEEEIIKQVHSLFNSLDIYFQTKNTPSQLEQHYKTLEELLDKYFNKYQNIDFVFQSNNLDEKFNQIKTYQNQTRDLSEKEMLKYINNLFDKYYNR